MMKNKKEHKTALPELRFPEFRDSEGWILSPLSQLLDYERPDSYIVSDTNYCNDGTPVLTANKSFILGYTKEDYGICNNVPVVIFDDFTVDKKYVDFPFKVKSSAIKILRPKKDNNLRFAFELMNCIKFETAEHKRYYISSYQTQTVPIPQPNEQNKIANCFSSLDDLISAVTDKIEALKEHKKGLMQRLFPTEGSAVPTLRFPEFQSAPEWEEATLSGVCDKIGDGLHGTPEYDENGEYYFVNGNNIKEGKLTLNGGTKMVSEYIANQNEKQISHKTVLMSINGTIGNVALYNYEKIMLSKSVAYLTVDTANECFVFYYLQTKTVQQQFCNSLTGSTIKNLGLEGIRNTLIYIPSPEEQKKIADCLTTIDNLIIAQSDRLKQLKAYKKGLMQRLFPKI